MVTDNLPMQPDPDDAIEILNKARLEMEARQEDFWRPRADATGPAGEDTPLVVVVIDEVAEFTRTSCAHRPSQSFGEALRKLTLEGRSGWPYYAETIYLCDTCRAGLYTPLRDGETEPTEAVCVKCGFRAPWEQVQHTARVKVPTQNFRRELMSESAIRAGERLLLGLRARSGDEDTGR